MNSNVLFKEEAKGHRDQGPRRDLRLRAETNLLLEKEAKLVILSRIRNPQCTMEQGPGSVLLSCQKKDDE